MAATLLALISLPGHSQRIAREETRSSAEAVSLRMEGFLRAVRGGDADSIAAFFPRRGEWTYRRTTRRAAEDRTGAWIFRAEDTRAAITGGPLAGSFRMNPEGQTVGRLVHQLRLRPGAWRQLPGVRFVPPGGTSSSDIYVSWRLEDGEWVISTLAEEVYAGARLPSWCC
jgi:hypothetical protein